MRTRVSLRLLGLIALLQMPLLLHSQIDPCPGWRNPTTFSNTNEDFFWSARVGERCAPTNYKDDTTTGYHVMSTCAASNATAIIGHANITNSKYNTGSDAGINCCSHTNLWDTQDKRFMIITQANAGIDEFTINSNGQGMSRIPEGYTSCIRLGDPRASYCYESPTSHTWSASHCNKGSEALFYTMQVTPENALLFINYAVVGRCYSHDVFSAGEFLIRVVAQKSDGTWPNEPINDNMWFKVSAPAIPQGAPPAPWVMGKPGSSCASTTCAYVYKPWTKVAVNLSEYIYDHVRIEIYTSDCVPTVDPLYAYICGDYQPMSINTTGCPPLGSDVIDSLSAPEGLLSYKWYVTTEGVVEEGNHLNKNYMNNVQFRQVFPLEGDTSDNNYMPTLSDFVLTEGSNAGDTVSKQTFMCVMTSAMDPNKPFESKVYVNVENRRPMLNYAYSTKCDQSAHFINKSTTYSTAGLIDDSTRWVVYGDAAGLTVLDTLWGDVVDYQYPAGGDYLVKLFCTTAGDEGGLNAASPCTAFKSFLVHIKTPPPADFTASDHRLCENETLLLSTELNTLTLTWLVDGDTLDATTAEVPITLPVGDHLITLITTNADTCSSKTTDNVKVFGQPSIHLESDIDAICPGDSVLLEAAGSVEYSWNAIPPDTSLAALQGQSVFQLSPSVTTTYYLLPSTDNPCSIEGAQVTIEVIPAPTPTIRANPEWVNIENPVVTLQDISPNAATAQWSFSDGGTASGLRVKHNFANLDEDSVRIDLVTCNRLNCCNDTSIHLPVVITTVWFPNAFTPDEDNNNRFGIITTLHLLEYEIYIYNRAGQLVHTSTDPNDPWDGTLADGRPAPMGTYAYVYRYSYSPDSYKEGKGSVTLLR